MTDYELTILLELQAVVARLAVVEDRHENFQEQEIFEYRLLKDEAIGLLRRQLEVMKSLREVKGT